MGPCINAGSEPQDSKLVAADIPPGADNPEASEDGMNHGFGIPKDGNMVDIPIPIPMEGGPVCRNGGNCIPCCTGSGCGIILNVE